MSGKGGGRGPACDPVLESVEVERDESLVVLVDERVVCAELL